jgi:hypothetical protein
MKIKNLKNRPRLRQNNSADRKYSQLQGLIAELKKKEFGEKITTDINREVNALNEMETQGSNFEKDLRKTQSSILKTIQEGKDFVPKNHYRNLWFVLGMTVFGIPLGVTFGVGLQNMAFIGIGLPLGMVIGIAVGTAKDKKAAQDGNQLDFEVK